MPTCPNCHSEKIVKNGRIHNGKQRFRCNQLALPLRGAQSR
ncbi:IS1 family transposase [Pleurocapsa sp. PCC 7319]